jgi:ribosomal protein L11 methyltransferase
MTSEWIEVQICSPLDAGEVLGLLGDPSVPGAWQDGRTIRLYWPSQHWTSDHLAHLRQTLRRLTEQGMAEPDTVGKAASSGETNHHQTQLGANGTN